MEPSTNGHNRPTSEEDDLPTGWRWTFFRGLGVLAFMCVVAFWIYVFANGDSIAHPDEFDDPVFAEAAESICAKRQANILEFPIATVAEDPVERSVLVAMGTEELELMVAELAQLSPTDPKGAESFPLWLDDYRLYISDREVWTAQLAAGEDEAFLLSANAQGGRVTDLLTTYADVNDMPSCAPSGDA